MILNAFENDVPGPKKDLWGHPFEVSHCSETAEVPGTLSVKYNDFQPLRDHRVLRAMSSPPATETADCRVNKACQELFWVCT